jgi:hypothetical protein
LRAEVRKSRTGKIAGAELRSRNLKAVADLDRQRESETRGGDVAHVFTFEQKRRLRSSNSFRISTGQLAVP